MFSNISLKKSKRFVFAIISDTHAGHLLGLLNPGTTFKEFDEEGEPYNKPAELSKAQEFLWDLYMDNRERVIELAKGCPIIVLHNGDLTIGLKYPTQMSFTAMSNQIIAAYKNMEPWLELPNLKAFRMTYGTQSHELWEGSAPRLVTQLLEMKYPDMDIRMFKHGLTTISGVVFNYAHHGPYPGSRKWLEGNVARYYLRDLMMRDIMAGRKPPDLNAYAHFHTYIEEKLTIPANGMLYRSHLLITPSYQLLGDYAQQATRSISHVTNGMIAVEYEGSHMVGDPHLYAKTSDIRTKEEIKL